MWACLEIQIAVPTIKCLLQDLDKFRKWPFTDMALAGDVCMDKITQMNFFLINYLSIIYHQLYVDLRLFF